MFGIKSKISNRLFFALFFVAVIPICIMGYGTYRAAQDAVIHTAFMHIETIAQDHANRLDIWFRERLSDIRVLSELSSVRNFCSMSCASSPNGASPSAGSEFLENSLALIKGKAPFYESIHMLSLSGEVLASTEPESEILTNRMYLSDIAALKNSGEPVLGPVHQHSNQRWYTHLIVPVHAEDGEVIGIILAILDVSGTLDPILTDRAGLGDTGETYLVNEKGRIVTESKYLDPAEASRQSFDTFGIRSALQHKDGTAIYTNYAGREVVGSYLWLPRYRWALLVEMGKDEILSPLASIKTTVAAATGVVGLLCVLVALVVSRRISRPIIRIADASREMALGSFDQRIAHSGSDEIGVLSNNFNSMAERLSVLIGSLRQKEVSLQKAYDDLLQTQEQLVQSEKMAAIGELVASVVHEMRNPLSSVKLNYQIIGRTIDKEGPLYEHYRIGLDQVAQLERMFSNLLDYSRPIALERVPFHIEEIVDRSIRQLEAHIKEHGTHVRGIEGSLPPVWGDPEKIGQVMVNVIKNAIEASGRDGKVEISASVAETMGKPVVTVDILDDGPGISSKDLKRIFQPFFTTKEKGTGLGLAIVKKIMEAHRSGISVMSEEGGGTVVSLRFQGA